MNTTLRLCPFVLPLACFVGHGTALAAQARADRGIDPLGDPAAVAAPASRETVVRLRSLAGYRAAGRLPSVPPMPPLMARWESPYDFLGIGKEDLFRPVGRDDVEHVARTFVERSGPNLEFGISVIPGSLAFQGDGEGARQFDLALDLLEAELEPRIAVTAKLVELAPGNGTLAERSEAGREVWTARAVGPAGWPLALSRTELQRYVHDYEVEVAEDAGIAAPITAAAFTGVSVVVVPHALAGSTDLVLMTQGVVSRPHRDIERRRVGVEGMPSLDVPTLNVLAWTSSERIEDGARSMVGAVSLPGDGRSLALVVSAQRIGARREAEGLAVLPTTALNSRALQQGYRRCVERSEGWAHAALAPVSLDGDKTEGPALLEVERIQDMVLIGLEPWIETTDVRVVGGCLVVAGPPEACAQARRIVAQLENSLLQNSTIEVRVPLAAAEGPEAGGQLHSVSIPGLKGLTHALVRGIETLDLDAYFVEISSKSSMLNPNVSPVFEGLIASVSLRPGAGEPSGSFLIEVLESGPVTRRPLEGKNGGDVDIRDVAIASFSHDGPIPSGGLVLGDGPEVQRDGRTWRSRVEVRAR